MTRSSRSRTPLLVLPTVLIPVLLLALSGTAAANTLKLTNTLPTGGKNPVGLALGDLNSDNATDVLVTNFNSAKLRIFLQTTSGGFATTNTTDLPLPSPYTGFTPKFSGVDVGDVDGDGRDDIAAGDVASQFIFLWRQTSPGGFTPPTSDDATPQMWPLCPAPIFVESISPTESVLVDGWLAYSVTNGPLDIHPFSAGYQVVLGDIYSEDGKRTSEVAAASFWGFSGSEDDDDWGAMHLTEWREGQDASGTPVVARLRQGWSVSELSRGVFVDKEFGPKHPIATAMGDFNNDGLLDILYGGSRGTINYMRRNGSRFWSMERANDVAISGYPVRATSGDLNDDGLDDAVVTSRAEEGAWSLILQDDLGHLGGVPATPKTVETTTDPVGVRIADVNDDGIDDLVIANARFDETTGSVSVVPQAAWPGRTRREPLSFERHFEAGRYPEDVEVGDFDGDGQNEVVAVNSNDGTMMYYDQVPPEPPGILVEGGSGAPVNLVSSSRRGAQAIVWLSDTTPVIRFTEPSPADLNGIVGYYWVLDDTPSTMPTTGSSFVATGTPITVGPLTSGTWYLHARSLDANGNLGAEAAHFQLNIDVTAPTAPVPSDGFGGVWSEADLRNVSWTRGTDGQSGVKDYVYSVDGGDEVVTTALSTVVSGLADGEHVFAIRARDNAQPANVSSTNTLIMRVDKGTPTCVIDSPTDSQLLAVNAVVSVSASDAAGISKVEIYVDGALKATDSQAPYTQTISMAGFATGSHTILARAYDMYGHTKDDAVVVSVDSTPPRIYSISMSPDPFYPLKRDGYKDDLWVRFTLSEYSLVRLKVFDSRGAYFGERRYWMGPGRKLIKWNGTYYTHGSLKRVGEGNYYLRFRVNDIANNITWSPSFRVRVRRYVVVILSGSRVKLVAH